VKVRWEFAGTGLDADLHAASAAELVVYIERRTAMLAEILWLSHD